MPSLEADSDMRATTPQSFRRDVAVEFLTQSDLPLLEVVACERFSEASTFNHTFKGWKGLSPVAYRQAHNKPAEGAVLA